MARNRIFYFLVTTLYLAAHLLGCTHEGDQSGNASVGLANPASIYCQGLGFQEETHQGELGQYGVCIFPDGSECDTWDFLAGRCGQEYSYCVDQGFKLQTSENSNIANCIFDDGSTCSEYLYFEGKCKPGDNLP